MHEPPAPSLGAHPALCRAAGGTSPLGRGFPGDLGGVAPFLLAFLVSMSTFLDIYIMYMLLLCRWWVLSLNYSVLRDTRSYLHSFVICSQMFAYNSEVQQLTLGAENQSADSLFLQSWDKGMSGRMILRPALCSKSSTLPGAKEERVHIPGDGAGTACSGRELCVRFSHNVTSFFNNIKMWNHIPSV